jgi:hypothetical protein
MYHLIFLSPADDSPFDLPGSDLYFCGYDSENASKEIENYDKMKSMLECHAASGDSEDFDLFNSNVDMGKIDMSEGFEENNIDCNSYDVMNNNDNNSNSNSNSNNNSGGSSGKQGTHSNTYTSTTSTSSTPNTPNTLHHNHQIKYNSVCPAIIRRLKDLDIIKNNKKSSSRKNSHDWEIKMLLTPESPPDTPRV